MNNLITNIKETKKRIYKQSNSKSVSGIVCTNTTFDATKD